MEDKLRLNTKLFGFDGIIGRRDFFLNGVLISAIALIYSLPYMGWLYSHIGTIEDFFHANAMFLEASIWLKLFVILGKIAVCILFGSNIYRRLNDIFGEVKSNINVICTAIFVLTTFSVILPSFISAVFSFFNFIIIAILLFKTGKITSNYPYDFRKEFNWGAFLGTWIWGLFNKSYKTLWMFIVGLTPWSTHFALYCGLKGNEWAFNNKKCDDVEKFNKSQEKQATIFAILAFLVGPILYVIIFALIFGFLMFLFTDDIKNTPPNENTKLEQMGSILDTFASSFFENHEITDNENKFYVLNEDWNGYSFDEKRKILDLAASMSAEERRKISRAKNSDSHEYFSKTEELNRTKIYSSETKELLGEFFMDDKVFENGSVKEIFKASMKAYRFYNPKNK